MHTTPTLSMLKCARAPRNKSIQHRDQQRHIDIVLPLLNLINCMAPSLPLCRQLRDAGAGHRGHHGVPGEVALGMQHIATHWCGDIQRQPAVVCEGGCMTFIPSPHALLLFSHQVSGGNQQFSVRADGINSMALLAFGVMDFEVSS